MFHQKYGPARTYANVDIETAVGSASPHKLILMLFEGALLSITMAISLMQENKVAEKGLAISKAMEIIGDGLKLSLKNPGSGNAMHHQLEALYDYMMAQLLYANQHNDVNALREVAGLLNELKSAWVVIAADPAVMIPRRIAA